MARHVFQTISFYGFCLPIAFPDQNERESWIKWAAESLEDIHVQLVDALDIFNETKSDRPFMETIDTFRRKQMIPINGSYGFERLRNVVDRTRRVMVFFGWLGSLFTNGVLGHLDKDFWSRQEEIYVGADGSQALQQYALGLIDDEYAFGEIMPVSDDPFVRVFYGKVDGRALPFVALLYLLQPGCELVKKYLEGDEFLDSFQEAFNELANISGYTGGDSNRCFHKFMIRYTDYNRTAYERLVDYIGKFLFQEVSVYGYCLAITRAESKERDDWMNWTEDGLQTILKQMSDALNVFDEPRPTLSAISSSTTALTSALPSNMPIAPTTSALEGSITLTVLERARDSVLPTAGMEGSVAWVERAKEHQTIANKIYQSLTATHIARYSVYFQVLVSLLQDKSHNDMQCMEIKNDRHIEGFNSHGVSYFIQYFKTADLTVGLNATWKDVLDKEAEIVNAVFSSKTQDLCKSAKKEIEKAVRSKVFDVNDGFSCLAVVRCGRRFVWYQLAYRYFTVGRTAGLSFMLTSGNGETYNANCGQIFLFP